MKKSKSSFRVDSVILTKTNPLLEFGVNVLVPEIRVLVPLLTILLLSQTFSYINPPSYTVAFVIIFITEFSFFFSKHDEESDTQTTIFGLGTTWLTFIVIICIIATSGNIIIALTDIAKMIFDNFQTGIVNYPVVDYVDVMDIFFNFAFPALFYLYYGFRRVKGVNL